MRSLLSLIVVGILSTGAAPGGQEQKEFYESGKLKAEFAVDEQGRKHGRYVEYYESGKKKITGAYDQGERHGEWWEFYESGKAFGKKGFDKGKPAGGIVRMDQNGVVLYRASMTKGRPEIYRDFKRLEPAYGRSLEEIRKQIEKIDPRDKRLDVDESAKFEIEPSATVPYRAGKLKAAYLQDALKHFNVYRYLSGVSAGVKLDDGYNEEAQYAAVVVEAHGSLSHTPPRRPDMDASFHAKGYRGAKSSNLHKGQGQLRKSIDGWMEDPGENNVKEAGHRGWCQNPQMGRVGFGECGGTFAQWAHDASGGSDHPDLIGYPFPGYHPLEYFGSRGPWSICPKDTRFKIPGKGDLGVRVWLLDEGFDFTQELEVNSKNVTAEYGSGMRAVFRPVLPSELNLEGQRFWVLISKSGAPLFGYFVHFVSLSSPEPKDPETSDRRK